jgi:hypothetical protein
VLEHPGAVANTYIGGTGMAKATDARRRAPVRLRSSMAFQERARTWALSPSDLTFLWEECPRCFFNKVALGERRPATPFPKVFGVIDRAMKDFYLGERADILAPGAPAGVIEWPDRWVKSAPIALHGCDRPVVLRGRLDAVVACDDHTEAVVDFKTALPGDSHIPLYGRQLHAYGWALERPSSGRPSEVSALGFLCFAPDAFEAEGTRAALLGDLAWIGVARDDADFDAFLVEVVSVLEAPEPPEAAPGCPWCGARTAAGEAPLTPAVPLWQPIRLPN